jgi:RiboL-PSP-HEPN
MLHYLRFYTLGTVVTSLIEQRYMPLKVLKKTPIESFNKELINISIIYTIAGDLDEHSVLRSEKKKDILYRSYIIYLMAAWQTFIKDTAREAFDALVVLEPCTIFHDTLTDTLGGKLKRFSSPKTSNINELIKTATGIPKISTSWNWNGAEDYTFAEKTLDQIWTVRCEIAHAVYASEGVSQQQNLNYMKFLFNLACVINNELASYITEKTGREVFRYRSLKYEEDVQANSW